MFAIVESGGKQYKVKNSDIVRVDSLKKNEGEEIIMDKVHLISRDGNTTIGSPYIEGAEVKAQIITNKKDKKVLVFKMKPRKGMRKIRGHRQPYSFIKILDINGG